MRRDHVLQFVLEAAQTPDFEGVTAQAVADALSIWRNDAAVELNKLVAEGKLRRVGKKNVRFFPASEETADIRPESAVQEELPQAEEETGQYRAFSGLVGADGSLKYQLRVAMAAVAYPPNGLNMLITGSTGSGKSHFARTIWEYAKETKALCGAHAPIPFVEFNCAEYADNPQLLLSHLFGYKKGAFTGALEDKPGLVEQANGGILFLDEIHGLSSTGQEMFFSLLDTGVFRRVGDNTPRTSRFMLIGATTKPLTDLLETFLRRMPVLISMPTLSDRPMKERLELVEHFYAEEAAHIGRTLRIQKGALNSILDYSLHSNLGVLKNLVQLSCAKAFLRENVAGNRTGEIAVTFSDLSFQTYNVSAETEKYAHGDLHFAEDLVVPNQRIQSSAADVASFVDVYDFVESRLSGEQEQHHDAGNLQQIIAAEIDNYYVDMERALQAPDVDRSLLDSVLFPGSIGICSEFLSRASYALNHVYPSIAATLLAMHLSQYVSRMRSEQPAFPLSVRGGLQGYGAELDFLRENRQWLAQAIKVHISTDEMNCLAVLLRQAGKKREKPPVWLTLASGSDGVAAGMARHLNAVYDTNHVHWVDSARGGSLFQSLCDHIATFHGEAGNLIFTDMKVLTTLEPELTKATGVPCRVIPILEQRLLLEASRLTLHPAQQDLNELRDQILEAYFRQMSHLFQTSGLDLPALREKYAEQTPEKVILSTCITGIGSARTIQEILQKRLAYIPRLHVVAVSALDSVEKLAEQYGSSLRLVVGTVEPNIPGVPFITADRVFSREGIMAIASIVDDWGMDTKQMLSGQEETSGGETISLLAQSLRYIAPHVEQQLAIDCIETMTRQLETGYYRRALPQDVRVRLFMHAASMLERIVNGNPLAMEPEHEELIRQNAAWFERLQALIASSFASFGQEIPRAEAFYFMLSLPQTLE